MQEEFERLLYSREEKNIRLALQLAEANPEFQKVVEEIKSWLYFHQSRRDPSIGVIIDLLEQKRLILKDKFNFIHESFGYLKHIQYVHINQIQIQNLPDSTQYLKGLKGLRLYLTHQDISSIPEALSKLENLKYLDIVSQGIGDIPEALLQLKYIEDLNLWENKLKKFPENIMGFQNLKYLNLGNNEMGFLPESIGELKNLETLYLRENYLSELPEALGKLTNLVELDLSVNYFSKLPDSMGNLKKLKSLSLDVSELGEVPASFMNLQSLEELHIEDTFITDKQIEEIQKALPNCQVYF